ncbi:hypothetical protein GCM10007916_02330 [Psychromonas marina]|uniref:Uncharacterized protein n=1 Tax=Psychromonas marina TaxID=88364 RepID=A0ABQ6DVP5_9GAMM|nr:hypothetical protein [Psychromonas marina]GLS89166.1 hypothetical protein GCM10007916_02330 [Psychromonas marina]
MKGAGGTSGGIGTFFIGLIMMIGGFYLLLNAISVTSNFSLGRNLYRFSGMGGNYSITSGMVMIPFMFGIGLIFYNSKNIIGWVLAIGSITALIFGVIASIQFSFKSMTAFDLIVILVLAIGGLGLFFKSLKSMP